MTKHQSLFAILARSPWWLSLVMAAALFAIARLFLPELIAASVAIPFAGIGAYAAWRQLRNPGPAEIERRLVALRGMSWQEFEPLIEEAFRREGYAVSQIARSDVDLELTRQGRISVASCKRWKVASTGVEPLRKLCAAGRAREAHESIYVAAGEFSANAREFAADNPVRLIDGAELVKLVDRVPRS